MNFIWKKSFLATTFGVLILVVLVINYKESSNNNISIIESKTVYNIGLISYTPTLARSIDQAKEVLRDYGEKNGFTLNYLTENTSLEKISEGKISFFDEYDGKVDLFITGRMGSLAIREKNKNIPIITIAFSELDGDGEESENYKRQKNSIIIESGNDFVVGDRLFYLTQILPNAKKILVPRASNKSLFSNSKSISLLHEAAKEYGVTIIEKEFESREEMNKFFLASSPDDFDAIFRYPDPFISANLDLIIAMSLQQNINKPIITAARAGLEKGGLLSYGTSAIKIGDEVAKLAYLSLYNKINLDSLPTQHIHYFELGINFDVARKFGIEVSPTLKNVANYIIEAK